MGSRFVAIASVLAALMPVPLAGQTRTAGGHHAQQGVCTNATTTPLERPKSLAGKATFTDPEAADFEKNAAKELQEVDGKSEHPLLAAAGSNGTGGYNILFIDRGSELARVD